MIQLAWWVGFFCLSPLGYFTVKGAVWTVDGLHARSSRLILRGVGAIAAVFLLLGVIWLAMAGQESPAYYGNQGSAAGSSAALTDRRHGERAANAEPYTDERDFVRDMHSSPPSSA